MEPFNIDTDEVYALYTDALSGLDGYHAELFTRFFIQYMCNQVTNTLPPGQRKVALQVIVAAIAAALQATKEMIKTF